MLHVQEHSLIIPPCPLFWDQRRKGRRLLPHEKTNQGSRNPSRNQTPDHLLRGSSGNLCTTVLTQGVPSNRVRWAVRGQQPRPTGDLL